MGSEREPRQRVQPVRFEGMQVAGAAQDPKNFEVTERHGDQCGGLDQPPGGRHESQAATDRLEDQVQSDDQDRRLRWGFVDRAEVSCRLAYGEQSLRVSA